MFLSSFYVVGNQNVSPIVEIMIRNKDIRDSKRLGFFTETNAEENSQKSSQIAY